MLRLRGRWIRGAFLLVLLLLIGLATYMIGTKVWANKQLEAAREALERYDFHEATERLEKYLPACPTDGEAWLLAAQTARSRGRFSLAPLMLAEARKNGIPAKAAHTERQLLATQQGDLAQAEELTQNCLKQPDSPASVQTLEALIEGGFRAGNMPVTREALEIWLKHRQGQIDQARGLVWRGRVNDFVNEHAQARADFRRAVELAPDLISARMMLVDALIRD